MTLTMKNPVSTIAVQTTAETKHNFYKRCADMNITASTAIRRIVEGIVKDPSILDDFGIHKPEGIHKNLLIGRSHAPLWGGLAI